MYIPGGIVHRIPTDMKTALTESSAALSAWSDITPLARNEWICWVTSVKKQETREKHITRMCADLVRGKRRPCCWSGCLHRK